MGRGGLFCKRENVLNRATIDNTRKKIYRKISKTGIS